MSYEVGRALLSLVAMTAGAVAMLLDVAAMQLAGDDREVCRSYAAEIRKEMGKIIDQDGEDSL